MFCKSCGTPISTKSPHCPHCGRATDAMSGGTGFWDLVEQRSSAPAANPSPVPSPAAAPPSPSVPTKLPPPEQEKPLQRKRLSSPLILVGIAAVLLLQIYLLSLTLAVHKEVEALSQQSGDYTDLIQELSDMLDSDEAITTSDSPALPLPSATTAPGEIDTDSLRGVTLTALATYADASTLHIEAQLPDSVADDCENNPALIKWWVNEGTDEQLDGIAGQQTGISMDYNLVNARGNSQKYVYYTITIDGTEYRSEPIYLLSCIISLSEKNGVVTPQGLEQLTGLYPAGENVSCYWEKVDVNASADTQWTRLEQSGYALTLETPAQFRYRFIVENAAGTIIAMVEYQRQ